MQSRCRSLPLPQEDEEETMHDYSCAMLINQCPLLLWLFTELIFTALCTAAALLATTAAARLEDSVSTAAVAKLRRGAAAISELRRATNIHNI